MRVQLSLPCMTRLGGAGDVGRGVASGSAAGKEPGAGVAPGGACCGVGPAKAIRPSVGGGVAGAGAMTARAWGSVGAAGAPTAGGVGRTAVTVADQPRADRGLAAAAPPLAGTWVATADGEGFRAALARMA